MYTNPAAGCRHHKCYDPEKPDYHTTVQDFVVCFFFLNHVTMILPSNVLFPFLINRKTALQKRKCPMISSSSSIYISICIYTYTQSQRYTHLCGGKNPITYAFFFYLHVVTHTLRHHHHHHHHLEHHHHHTIVFCCVCSFFSLFRKKNQKC